MKHIKLMTGFAPAAACALLLGANADAGQARAQMGVNATVLAVAHMQLASAPTAIQLSADDLRRGYVDVPQPTSLLVNSNSPNGFALDFIAVSPMMSSFIVTGPESDQVLDGDGGTLIQRWREPGSMRLHLKFRLILAPGLAAGSFVWPLRLRVRPL